jgi:putative thiamine transport system substrate-binding protein
LPNWELVDVAGNPSLTTDFTVPVEGFQAPWGTVQFSFYYDSEEIDETPSNLDELLAWVEANPGRFTYPQPPNFLGSTFLKLLLAYTIDDRDRLGAPLPEGEAEAALAPLFAYLDELHPHLWRSGVPSLPTRPRCASFLAMARSLSALPTIQPRLPARLLAMNFQPRHDPLSWMMA